MQIFVEQSYFDKNIKDVSEKSEIEIISKAPKCDSYFTYDSKGLSFIGNADNPKNFLNEIGRASCRERV